MPDQPRREEKPALQRKPDPEGLVFFLRLLLWGGIILLAVLGFFQIKP